MRARSAAIVGVLVAVSVAGLALRRRGAPALGRAVETTHAIRMVRRDKLGLPEKKATVSDRVRVRALTEALGIDEHRQGVCPADYAEADIGLVLTGNDVYARRNVYVFALRSDADAGVTHDARDVGDASIAREPSVVSVTSAGCRVGPPADIRRLKRELRAAGITEDMEE